ELRPATASSGPRKFWRMTNENRRNLSPVARQTPVAKRSIPLGTGSTRQEGSEANRPSSRAGSWHWKNQRHSRQREALVLSAEHAPLRRRQPHSRPQSGAGRHFGCNRD